MSVTNAHATAEIGVISTIAGDGVKSFGGDGGIATNAKFNNPRGVTVDSAGNIYIADDSNHRVRKIDVNGIVTTIAGNGTGTFSGDGGLATLASLHGPQNVALDSIGNIYISDSLNHRVRKIDLNGIITTVAGTGQTGTGAESVAATSTPLDNPYNVALNHRDELYITSLGSRKIRKVDKNGIIITIAGNGTNGHSGDGGAATSAQLNTPVGITLDATGALYIAQITDGRIRKVDTDGTITTIAGTGQMGFSGDGDAAINAKLNAPRHMSVDVAGNLYIADRDNHRIRKINPQGIITSIAGSASSGFQGDGAQATLARLYSPYGVSVSKTGQLYIADEKNQRIRSVNLYVPPDPPTDLAATPGNAQAVVSWTGPLIDGGSPITQYTVTATPGNLSCSALPANLSCTLQGLSNGVTYTLTATASNLAGASIASPQTTVTPVAPPPPLEAPFNIAAEVGNAQLVVSWSAPLQNGGSTITTYKAQSSPGQAFCSVDAALTRCTITGLTDGQTYDLTVTATNAANDSATSTAISVALPKQPQNDLPNNIQAVPMTSKWSLALLGMLLFGAIWRFGSVQRFAK